MPTAFSKLKRASWNGIEYPVRRMSVRGSLNHHVHVYPHTPGGAFENLERKLYEIHMNCPFMQRFAAYPDLWPTRLATLRNQFETGAVGVLNIPTIGSIKARCVAWPEEMDAKIQSGVMVDLEFIEDQSNLALTDNIVEASGTNMQDAATALASEVENEPWHKPGDIFDSIHGIANQIFAIRDQVDLETNLLEAKILGLDAILQEADRTVVDLQKPDNYPVLNALRDLWATSQRLLSDLQSKHASLQIFTVPMTMSVSDVSSRIYGDNSHAVELMQLNSLDDAFAIPTGTQMKYYAPDSLDLAS